MPEQFAHHLSIGFSAPAGLAASVRAVSVMTVRSRSPVCSRACGPPAHEIAPHADLRFAARLNCAETQHVTHFFLFGPQIGNGVRIGLSFAGQPRHDLDAVSASAMALRGLFDSRRTRLMPRSCRMRQVSENLCNRP